ncbi:hypothetical protein [Mycolicibacterium sp. NCC-Tsukiji]|uniref:hypothetical protein n=1 Tax=Mycolicibacterium sp. NCC-Tsukiji TaxID=2185272 RepID=UPI00107F43DB|nr:hypothetical protein [Mycolicibacterium sp. NCC-Tsukiji]
MARRKGGLTSRLISAAIASRLSRDEEVGGMTLPNVRLWLGGERNQPLGDSVVLQVRSAGLPCDVIATGEIDVPRRMRQPRTLHLRPAMLNLPPLRKATLAVEIPPVAQRKAARALKRGEPVIAVIEVEATDSRGSSARVKRRISLSPPRRGLE